MPNKTERKLITARTKLLLDNPFFGRLLYNLKLECDYKVRRMATDGVSILYNPTFADTLPMLELMGVLAHEVMHNALKHHIRRNGRNITDWNKACDYAINPVLLDSGLKLPKNILVDERFRDMGAESIYNILLMEKQSASSSQSPSQSASSSQSPSQSASSSQSPSQSASSSQSSSQSASSSQSPSQSASSSQSPSQSASSSQSSSPDKDASKDGKLAPSMPDDYDGDCGQVLDAPIAGHNSNANNKEKLDQETLWNRTVQEAINISRIAGKLPGNLKRTLHKAENANINWEEALRRTFCETIPSDYTWMPPNHRFVHAGLYLPSLQKDGIGDIVVAIDCSGSISDRILGLFQCAINRLIEDFLPTTVHVLYFDTTIIQSDVYPCGTPVDLHPVGGGGTTFIPVFEWIEEKCLFPQNLIVFTDLYGCFPKTEPPYPVIWACTSESTAPFGETIPLSAA